MIATILPSSSCFHAIDYNERKVAKGNAELLEISNFGYIGKVDRYTPDELRDYMMEYSSRNDRIKYPQFHVALSCKGNEYSSEELREIAHRYLKEMGYDNPGQPLLIYAHHDTDNNHIHIVTSRIAPDGHKINHSHEKRRSLEVINRIMGINENQRMNEAISMAMQYQFSSVSQFKAILESLGYETFDEKSDIVLKRGGAIQGRIGIKEVEKKVKKALVHDKAKIKKLRALLLKYRGLSSSKEELASTIKEKFGCSIVFFGKADSPYGYVLIDHKEKVVVKVLFFSRKNCIKNTYDVGWKLRDLYKYILPTQKTTATPLLLTTHTLERTIAKQIIFNCISTTYQQKLVIYVGDKQKLCHQIKLSYKSNL